MYMSINTYCTTYITNIYLSDLIDRLNKTMFCWTRIRVRKIVENYSLWIQSSSNVFAGHASQFFVRSFVRSFENALKLILFDSEMKRLCFFCFCMFLACKYISPSDDELLYVSCTIWECINSSSSLKEIPAERWMTSNINSVICSINIRWDALNKSRKVSSQSIVR